MDRERRTRSGVLRWALVTVGVAAAILLFRVMWGRPSFDADKVARAETRMWQAYYSDDKTELGLQLIALLRNQHSLTLLEAKDIGELLASAAMEFHQASGAYDQAVLPDLTQAYRRIRQATGAPFDPDAAARAELAWWVARRTPGQNAPAQVGEIMAGLYALLYGHDQPAFHRAGLLRAQAAALRDSGGRNADWPHIQDLLQRSYRELRTGI
jgi:hypothetical protein